MSWKIADLACISDASTDKISLKCPHPDCVDRVEFKDEDSYLEHFKKHEPGKFQCPFPGCGKTFNSSSGLRFHKQSVHEGKKFSCSFCDQKFSQKSTLNEHMNAIHLPIEKLLVCPVEGCRSEFKTKKYLNRHIKRVHERIRNFKCNYPGCERDFFLKCELEMHKNEHESGVRVLMQGQVAKRQFAIFFEPIG